MFKRWNAWKIKYLENCEDQFSNNVDKYSFVYEQHRRCVECYVDKYKPKFLKLDLHAPLEDQTKDIRNFIGDESFTMSHKNRKK